MKSIIKFTIEWADGFEPTEEQISDATAEILSKATLEGETSGEVENGTWDMEEYDGKYEPTNFLTPEDSEKYFFNALCNGESYISSYGLEIVYNLPQYKKAKLQLEAKKEESTMVCREDVYMQMLRNGDALKMYDSESEETLATITLKDVHDRVQRTPIRHLADMMSENDDAETADVILQSVFLGEVVYG